MPALTGDTPIIASGTVTLTMIVNLKRFVQRGQALDGAGIDLFEQVRGTPPLADAAFALKCNRRADDRRPRPCDRRRPSPPGCRPRRQRTCLQ